MNALYQAGTILRPDEGRKKGELIGAGLRKPQSSETNRCGIDAVMGHRNCSWAGLSSAMPDAEILAMSSKFKRSEFWTSRRHIAIVIEGHLMLCVLAQGMDSSFAWI